MKVLLLNCSCFLLFHCLPFGAVAQMQDHNQTLTWVKRQADRIDSTLHDAIRSAEPFNLMFKLLRTHRDFDAVAQAGLYCHEARIAAEQGRFESDMLGYKREMDQNSLLLRAAEARRQALRMRIAAVSCEKQTPPSQPTDKAFTPSDVLQSDAEIIELDLSDAISTRDFHILAQKIEHALRVLRDIEILAASLNGCAAVESAAQSAIVACMAALTSDGWDAAAIHVQQALNQIPVLKNTSDCK